MARKTRKGTGTAGGTKRTKHGLPFGTATVIEGIYGVSKYTVVAVLNGERMTEKAVIAIRDFCGKHELPLPSHLLQ